MFEQFSNFWFSSFISFSFWISVLKRFETSFEPESTTSVWAFEEHDVKEKISLDIEPCDRPLVIIEDIVDTGNTMEMFLKKLREQGWSDVRLATLLFKPEAFHKDFKVDYIGRSIPNDFIVGYGLDYDELGRNLPDIYKIV